ncbi:hypothetical protein [Paludisphaera rhizosphaerae]|nr:hypothetical protein [Paludisphaera rhizosphaerae]
MYSEHHFRKLASHLIPLDRLPLFIEAVGFRDEGEDLALSEADLHILQLEIAAHPTAGDVIAGTNGVRKVRFTAPGSGRGKRGSYRVFYIALPEYGVVVLAMTLAKGEKDNLTKAERNVIAGFAATIKAELDKEYADREERRYHNQGQGCGQA